MSTAAPEQKRLKVRLLTPDGAAFEGFAVMVVAPSVMGDLGILPRHAPIIAALRIGETRFKPLEGEDLAFATTTGYMSVEEDQVLMMVEQAEPAANINRARAEEALRRAEEAVAAATDEPAAEAAQAALMRAQNRLKVVDQTK